MCLSTQPFLKPQKKKQVDLNRKFVFKHSQREWTGVPIMAANMYAHVSFAPLWIRAPRAPSCTPLVLGIFLDRLYHPLPLSKGKTEYNIFSLSQTINKMPPKKGTRWAHSPWRMSWPSLVSSPASTSTIAPRRCGGSMWMCGCVCLFVDNPEAFPLNEFRSLTHQRTYIYMAVGGVGSGAPGGAAVRGDFDGHGGGGFQQGVFVRAGVGRERGTERHLDGWVYGVRMHAPTSR